MKSFYLYLIFSVQLFSVCYASEMFQEQQDEEDFVIDTTKFIQYLQVTTTLITAFTQGIDFWTLFQADYTHINQLQQTGGLPQSPRPEQLSYLKVRHALSSEIIRLNLFMTKVNMSELLKQARNVVTGDLSIEEYLDFVNIDDPLSSDNTADNIEIYFFTLFNFIKSLTIYPQQVVDGLSDPSYAVPVDISDEVRAFATKTNERDLIKNEESLSAYEVAYTWAYAYTWWAQNYSPDVALGILDYCIQQLDSTFDYDFRTATAPDS